MNNHWMKKVIYVFISLVMCLQINYVYGEDRNVVVDQRILSDGHVEVVININDNVKVSGGSFEFSYNNEKLTIDSIKYNKEQNMYIVANEDYKGEGHIIKITFASAETIKGNIAVITFSNKEKTLNKEDIVIQQCKIGDENGDLNSTINETTIQSRITEGDSMIDDTMEDIEKNEANQQKKVKKDKEKDTKEVNNENKTIAAVSLGILILFVIFILKKNHKK